MHSFTVYDSGDTFRVVSGEHKTHEGAAHASVRVYQGSDAIQAACAAYSAEQRNDIRTQIARFIPTERLPHSAPIHTFNTGRLYTTAGQRIAWTVLRNNCILMVDADRMIEYVLDSRTDRTNSGVLNAYDRNQTDAKWHPTSHDVAPELLSKLWDAARAVPGV